MFTYIFSVDCVEKTTRIKKKEEEKQKKLTSKENSAAYFRLIVSQVNGWISLFNHIVSLLVDILIFCSSVWNNNKNQWIELHRNGLGTTIKKR